MKKILKTGINCFLGKQQLAILLDNIYFDEIDKIVGIDNFISSQREKDHTDSIK